MTLVFMAPDSSGERCKRGAQIANAPCGDAGRNLDGLGNTAALHVSPHGGRGAREQNLYDRLADEGDRGEIVEVLQRIEKGIRGIVRHLASPFGFR